MNAFDPTKTLLRFLSKDLSNKIRTRVRIDDDDRFIELFVGQERVGSRRLGKKKCCESDSPCIGYVKIDQNQQTRFELPAYVHFSLCFDEIEAFRQSGDDQNDAKNLPDK